MKTLAFALVLLAATGLVAAEPHEYLLGLGSLVLCNPLGMGPDIGGVCMPPGHIGPDDSGQASITISDDVVATPGGFVCQDANEDAICGGDGELGLSFCGDVVLTAGVNWEPAADLHLYINDPVFGSPLFATCGLVSFGVHGFVYHT